ncbi:unnamed protein product, partial [Choristocarpus tenellus]
MTNLTPRMVSEALACASDGEWAGWECQFSGFDGSRIAVAEDYVPESLREWDVEVWGFETLTSEQWRTSGGWELYRKRGRVFPEVGCSLDNLSLEVNAQNLPLVGDKVSLVSFSDGSYMLGNLARRSSPSPLTLLPALPTLLSVAYKNTQNNKIAATKLHPLSISPSWTPQHPDAGGGVVSVESCLRLKDGPQRARFQVGFDIGKGKLGTVTITRERKYRVDFDDGELYKGGGLDSQNLGRLLGATCFAETSTAPTSSELAGDWISVSGYWQV